MKRLALLALAASLAGGAYASAANQRYSTRTLSDARVGTSKTELVAQRAYSAGVVLRLRRSWRVAPRHRTCWAHVPWSRVCDRTRRRLHAQRWLLGVAASRLERLYPPRPSLPFAFWDCVATGRLNGRVVSRGEGGATSVDPTGTYFGRYQEDRAFQRRWGADMLRKYGGKPATSWSVYDQTVVAERGFHGQGPGAWPNTAPPCLSLR